MQSLSTTKPVATPDSSLNSGSGTGIDTLLIGWLTLDIAHRKQLLDAMHTLKPGFRISVADSKGQGNMVVYYLRDGLIQLANEFGFDRRLTLSRLHAHQDVSTDPKMANFIAKAFGHKSALPPRTDPS